MIVLFSTIVNFLVKSGLYLFIFVIGAQFISKKQLILNYAFIWGLENNYEELLKMKKIPLDGWLGTFIVCMIPGINLLYVLFLLSLCVLSEENENIVELRALADKIKRGE